MRNDGEPWMFILYTLMLLAAGATFDHVITREMIRADAIKAGVAEYTVDPQAGVTQFKWKSHDE